MRILQTKILCDQNQTLAWKTGLRIRLRMFAKTGIFAPAKGKRKRKAFAENLFRRKAPDVKSLSQTKTKVFIRKIQQENIF